MRFQALRFAVHKVNFTSYVIASQPAATYRTDRLRVILAPAHPTLHAITYKASLRCPGVILLQRCLKVVAVLTFFIMAISLWANFNNFADGNNDLVILLYSAIM